MNTNQSPLFTTLKEFQATKQIAETPVFGDPKTAPGREGARKQAVVQLESIKKTLEAQLNRSALTVLVTGPKAEEWITEALKVVPAVRLNGDGLARSIAEAIWPTIGTHKTFGVNQYGVMVRELRQLGVGLNLGSLPSPTFKDSETARDIEEVTKIVARYMRETTGDPFQKLALESEALTALTNLKATQDSNSLPVLISVNDPNDTSRLGSLLFSGKFKTVETSADTDVISSVANTFNLQTKSETKNTETPVVESTVQQETKPTNTKSKNNKRE